MNSLPTVPQKPLNSRLNKTLAIPQKSFYSEPNISLFTIAYYSTNKAMLFYVASNVFSAWYLSRQDMNRNERYFIMAILLYTTQIVYNFLDLNSKNNLERLEAMT